MRLVLVLLLVAIVFWLIRSRQAVRRSDPNRSRQAVQPVQDMVACHACGVHLAIDDAAQTPSGRYYCPEHVPPAAR